MNYIKNQWQTVTFVSHLPLSKDVGHFLTSKNCHLEQIAYFSDVENSLEIVKSKWAQLNWLNKAMLVAHELTYVLDRLEGLENLRAVSTKSGKTSESARWFVGRLFSTMGLTAHSYDLPEMDKVLECSNRNSVNSRLTYFYVFQKNENQIETLFNAIQGADSLYQIKSVFNADLKSLTDPLEKQIELKSKLLLSGANRSSGFLVELTRSKDGHLLLSLFDTQKKFPVLVGEPQEIFCAPVL